MFVATKTYMDIKIDIDEIIESKNPKLAKYMPGFVKNYIKRTIHQQEINHCLTSFGDKQGTEFIGEILNYLNISHRIIGEENVPKDGRYIFASNHPLGGLDGMVLAYEIERIFGSVKLIVNDLLMNLTPLNPIFVPVNKHGRQTSEYAKTINELYDSEEQIITFPFGLCSRKIDGKIQDGEWRRNFVIKAIDHKRDVVPVFVDARNSNFFYNLANIRKSLGVKANIEMFYLADELFKQRNGVVDIYLGEPLCYSELDRNFSPQEWASNIREIAYSLKKRHSA